MDITERIFDLLSRTGMEQKQFAKEIGVIPQTITDWKNQKSKSYTKYLPEIANVLNTTTEYLLTGKQSTIADNAIIRKIGRSQISADALEVAFAYDDASSELQTAVRRVLGLE